MGIHEMMTGSGLSFGYKVLGEGGQLTVPGDLVPKPVRVIYSVDGTALLDGMVQSVGPSLRIRLSEAPGGTIPRDATFALQRSGTWRAKEKAQLINDGSELLVLLGVA